MGNICFESVYKPREDSTLLSGYVKEYAKGNVLDIGTGSGIQAISASSCNNVKSVLAVDIQKLTIDYCRKNVINKKIKFIASDLFENVGNKKFDTIIFNPPYLPNELKVKDLTLEGGKKGYEVVERFLNDVNGFLKPDGVVLIVFSSLTKKEKVDEFISKNLLEFELLGKQRIFFEELYVYKIEQSSLLKTLEKKNIKNIKYLAKGKRGFVFKGELKNKLVGIKIKNPESEAILRVENEINFLKLLNKKGIGPKLLFFGEDYLVYEFVEGVNISEFFNAKENNNKNIKKLNNGKNKKIILKIIKNILNQMFTMDKLKINKEEMSHPHKHIIIDSKYKPVLIDFERVHYTINPSNVTQFSDFLISKHVSTILKKNNIKINKNKIINAAKQYKKQPNQNNFNKIVELIK
jgi:release factor glutamine methyltransferase